MKAAKVQAFLKHQDHILEIKSYRCFAHDNEEGVRATSQGAEPIGAGSVAPSFGTH